MTGMFFPPALSSSLIAFKTSWLDSILGKRTASGSAFATALMSFIPQGESKSLTLTTTSRFPYFFWFKKSTTFDLDYSLASIRIGSPKSRIMESTFKVFAFSK